MAQLTAPARAPVRPLSNRLFNQLIFAGLGAGFAALLIMVAAVVWLVSRDVEFNRWVNRSYQVAATVSDFRVMFERAEAGRRGYLLSGETNYRGIYSEAEGGLDPAVELIRQLTADNPAQQERVARLKPLLKVARDFSNASVDRAGAGNLEGARDQFLAEPNAELMAGVRQITADMAEEERRLLLMRNDAQKRNAQTLLVAVLGAAVLLAVVAMISLALMRRYARNLMRSQDALTALNEGLEQAVQDRTAALSDANERLEAIVARQAALLREVNHRVANSLQLVSSLVQMQTMAVADGAARHALLDTQARIAAIMQVHRRLYTSDDVEFVDMGEYLTSLVDELQQSLAAGASRPPIRLQAEAVQLKTDKAVSVGVVVTELVTNACKYAYPDGADGEVRVFLSRDASGRLHLTVEDDGKGMKPGGQPQGTGLGQRVVAAMAKSLGSKLEFDTGRQGVRATLSFAL